MKRLFHNCRSYFVRSKGLGPRMVLGVSLFCLLCASALYQTGCGTNAPTKDAQGEQILIHTVNDGMAEWANYVNAGKATQKQIDTVHKAYDDYYAAQQVAKAVIEKSIAKDPNTSPADIATANAAVEGAESSLLSLLNQFLIKK